MIVLIAGLMGSGKSTVLASLVRTFKIQFGLRVAVLVLGEFSPDSRILIPLGININQLMDGCCVNCQLGGSAAEMVCNIINQERPDLVLFELSGLTIPGEIRNYLSGVPDISRIPIITVMVVDLSDPEQLHKSLDHLIEMMVIDAEIVAFNRIDLSEKGEIDEFCLQTQGINQESIFTSLTYSTEPDVPHLASLILDLIPPRNSKLNTSI
jgi:G3E family GTPase